MTNSSTTKKHILVNGGAGFVGSHLVAALLANDYAVTVLDDFSTGSHDNVPESAEIVEQDINGDISSIIGARDTDVVFHLAAQASVRESLAQPVADTRTNVLGGVNVIAAACAHGVEHLITFSSGGAIYDPSAELPHTESSPIAPSSPYGLAQHTLERYQQLISEGSIPHQTVLRPSNIYGPRQGRGGEAGVIAIFIQQLLAGEPLSIYGDGTQTRDFVYVQDVVRAAQLVLDQQLSGVFNVSTGTQTSVNEIAKKLRGLAEDVSVVHQDAVAGEVEHSMLSAEKLQRATGWSARTSFVDGLKETYRYELNHAD